MGRVRVVEDERGPDRMDLRVHGLLPFARITVFLTHHQDPGKLPAQFIGEFTTDAEGKGSLFLITEIVYAFDSANQTLEDDMGVADDPEGGNLPVPLGGTANTNALNWFRGYFVDIFPHNVFGPEESEPGGAPAFISDPALP